METEMNSWNDDRLDELNGRVKDGFVQVDKRFDKVDERFVHLEGEMKQGFEKVDERFVRLEGEMKQGFAKVDERFQPVASRQELAELSEDVRAGLNRINDRIDRIHHAVLIGVIGVLGTLIANGIWG